MARLTAITRLALLVSLRAVPRLAALQGTPVQEPPARAGAPGGQAALLDAGWSSAAQTVRLDELQRLEGADGQCLNFLHIPKTAGTSIEAISVQVKSNSRGDFRAWGMHDGLLKCRHPFQLDWGPGCEFPELPKYEGAPQRCALWHTPPAWDEQLAASYGSCTTFCVVRDPVARLVSEAEFQLDSCNATEVTSLVATMLDVRAKGAAAMDCHLLPQAEFVHGGSVLGKRGTHCQRVLKMETLAQDFADLMREFKINATLVHNDPVPPSDSIAVRRSSNQSRYLGGESCDTVLPRKLRSRVMAAYKEDYESFDRHRRWRKLASGRAQKGASTAGKLRHLLHKPRAVHK